jgi:hypothetical protein
MKSWKSLWAVAFPVVGSYILIDRVLNATPTHDPHDKISCVRYIFKNTTWTVRDHLVDGGSICFHGTRASS